MKRKVLLWVLCILLLVTSCDRSFAARSTKYADSARSFQKALDDGATDIVITESFSGNFVIPRWVYSISGRGRQGQEIIISPADKSKPVFDAESSTKKNLVRAAEVAILWPAALIHGAMSNSTSDSLEFSYLTILCGTGRGIDTNSISKQVNISNVHFKKTGDGNVSACYPSTSTRFRSCTFEDVTWGIYAVDTAGYTLEIDNCTFKNVAQALAMNDTSSKAKASFTNCKGENLGYWVFQHEPGDSQMYVTVDQSTISSCPTSDFFHRCIDEMRFGNDYSSSQLRNYIEDLSHSFKSLNSSAQSLILGKQNDGWDTIRLYAMGELNRKIRALDLSESSYKQAVNECIDYYALLASAPVSNVIKYNNAIRELFIFSLCEETLKSMVSDKNLIRPMIASFFDSMELAPLARVAGRISWGNSGNARQAYAKLNQEPDRIFRENIHRLQDWLNTLDEAQKIMKGLSNEIQSAHPEDYNYITEYEKNIRAVYDFAITVNRVAAAIYFDLPTNVAFTANFARVKSESNPSRIMGICRELGAFYSVSQRLCVLNRTQTIRNELLKTWKKALTVNKWLGSDDTSKYDELIASMGTDPDIMRDAVRIQDFFREWR